MQLRDIVDGVTAGEPPMTRTADDIVAGGRKAERRRRAGLAATGAAGLVVVVTAGVFALPSFTGGGTPATPAAPVAAPAAAPAPKTWPAAAPFTFSFEGYKTGKLKVGNPVVASTAYQIAPITRKGAQLYAYLTVYAPGAFDPAGVTGGELDGDGVLRATLPFGLDPANPVDAGNKLVGREYADDAWAVVTSVSPKAADPSFDDLAAVLDGLKPAEAKAAPLPFTVGYVPAGYQPLQVGSRAMPGLDGVAAAGEGDFGGATFVRELPAATGLAQPFDQGEDAIADGFHIFVTPSENSNQKAKAGQSECYPGGFCNVWSADGKVQVQVSAQTTGNQVPESELSKVAASITVADVADESTWTPATEALGQA